MEVRVRPAPAGDELWAVTGTPGRPKGMVVV